MKFITIIFTSITIYPGNLIVIIEEMYVIPVVEFEVCEVLMEKVTNIPTHIGEGYISNHWMDENKGTGLSNFDRKDLEVYQTAIDIYNYTYPARPIEYWLSNHSMGGKYSQYDVHSLSGEARA